MGSLMIDEMMRKNILKIHLIFKCLISNVNNKASNANTYDNNNDSNVTVLRP